MKKFFQQALLKKIGIPLLIILFALSGCGNEMAEPDDLLGQDAVTPTTETAEGETTSIFDEGSDSEGPTDAEPSETAEDSETATEKAAESETTGETEMTVSKIAVTEAGGTAESRLKDRYLTDEVQEGKPKPMEPQDISVSSAEKTCTLSVVCHTILDNLDNLDPDKFELVPEDGIIFPAQTVVFYEGESVFNVLQREMKKNKIHMEFVNTAIYNSAYIEGIHNLYEFDCGDLSGWVYKVNGWFPNYGSSRYQLQDGDVIEWVYTCDLGRDVGEIWQDQ